MKVLILISGAALVFGQVGLGATPTTQQWLVNLDQGSGNVEFNATGRPSALKIHGKGAAPKGNLKVESGTATGTIAFDLNTLDTGIEMRNKHMKTKYLETEKFGQSSIQITKLSIPEALMKENGSVNQLPFQGILSLHGVQKPVTGMAKVARNGNQLNVTADFGLKISDFGIASPGFAGITMADDVQIIVQSTAPLSTL